MKLWQKAVGVVLCGPLGLWMADLYPPIGSESFLLNAIFSITLCSIGYVIGVLSLNNNRYAIQLGKLSLVTAIVSLCIYALVYLVSVVYVEQRDNGNVASHRVIVGYELRNASHESYSNQELLERYGNAELIWTKESLMIAKITLFLFYNISFLLLTLGLVLVHKRN